MNEGVTSNWFQALLWRDPARRALVIVTLSAALLAILAAAGVIGPALAVIAMGVVAAVVLWPWVSGPAARRDDVVHPREELSPEGLLGGVIASVPDPVVLVDPKGRVVDFNAAAAALAPALRRGELALVALRPPEIVAALRRAIATGETQRTEYVERVPLDRWLELIVTPLPAVSAAAARFILLTFHDLTPLRRVEEMRADFVANASHELRTPLAALSGFIDTLQGPARDDPAARERFLGIMRAQATRMARLIDDLLSLSRIELSAHVRPEGPVDVRQVVRQVVDGLESLASERQVTLTVREPEEAAVVPGDRDELLRLFENLIENALKYGASGGRVEISFARTSGAEGEPELRVAVRDFGPGIAPEHLPRLTERFYRVDVGESRALGGTGLGLSLVKHILSHHRGRLLIESVAGAGATFTACLPLQRVAPARS